MSKKRSEQVRNGPNRSFRISRAIAAGLLLSVLILIFLGAPGCASDDAASPAGKHSPETALSWLTATRGEQAGVFDALGRQVLLRGVNFNHLGDYFQVHPDLPTVAALGADDWDDAAALGTNVIRLVTTWSAWEPQRDRFDTAYLARVRAAVAEANVRGMYVVIDMHQDAWSRYVFTSAGETCPEETHHQKGWDGAPLWATFTDGEPTCTPGRREDSPAVQRAWDNFYADRDGIRDELAELWAFIASEFGHEPGVAGYDLLNEPGNGSSGVTTREGISSFYRSAIRAIREAEAKIGAPGHLIFFEPSVYAALPEFDLSEDPNLVFAPHNYAESIGPSFPGLLDLSFTAYSLLGQLYGTALWIGEYNRFSDPETNEEWTARFAALEDRFLISGGAWWQWEQECGDPHNVQHPPTPAWLEQQRERCGDARFGVSTCLSRAYPRAAPGRLESVSTPSCGMDLVVTGSTEAPGSVDLWLPARTGAEPAVAGTGILSVNTRRVNGGWRIEVVVDGDYTVEVTPGAGAVG